MIFVLIYRGIQNRYNGYKTNKTSIILEINRVLFLPPPYSLYAKISSKNQLYKPALQISSTNQLYKSALRISSTNQLNNQLNKKLKNLKIMKINLSKIVE